MEASPSDQIKSVTALQSFAHHWLYRAIVPYDWSEIALVNCHVPLKRGECSFGATSREHAMYTIPKTKTAGRLRKVIHIAEDLNGVEVIMYMNLYIIEAIANCARF